MKSTGFAIAISVLACVVARPRIAFAEGPYEGSWRATPMEVRLAIESWGRDCGARPPTQSTLPGGMALIQQSGDHLRINGAVSGQTNGCWTDNRSVRRISTSYRENTWRTVCRTPENDPRSEVGTYTLAAQDPNRLELREETRYDWQLNESRCVATRTSRQTLRREVANSPPQQVEKAPTPPPTQPACTPGPAARLQLQPSRAQIEPGSQTCFRAHVADARGCPLPGERVRWELERPATLVARLRNGCFSAGATAAEAEGEYRVIASSGTLRSSAVVVVRTADLSDLIARRVSPAEPVPSELAPESAEARRVTARAIAMTQKRNLLVWGGVGAALFLLLATTIVVAALRRRRRTRTSAGMDMGPESERPVPIPAKAPAPPPADEARALDQALICPACRRGYPADARFCPHDAEGLIPYALFVERGKQGGAEIERAKICPRCGERYPRAVTFCGKDGSELVLVN